MTAEDQFILLCDEVSSKAAAIECPPEDIDGLRGIIERRQEDIEAAKETME